MKANLSNVPGRRLRVLAVLVLAGALALLLGACATLAPPPSPEPLFEDALFGSPPRPPEADTVFAVDDAMRAHLQQVMIRTTRPADRPYALAESLYLRGELRLLYDAASTRNAAQAFAARAGNCLSLVVMTAAMAREMGLTVRFQQVQVAPVYSRHDDLTLRSGHVNLALAPAHTPWRPGSDEQATDQVVIDFLPPEMSRRLRVQFIDRPRVLAMFMNNRAVEALLARQWPEAYAWVREALRLDPGYAEAYNTLGVVYQRGGHLALAVAAFTRLLALEPQHVPAMHNLERVLVEQGRLAEAGTWAARRQALEPEPPFHFLRLGLQALDRQEPVAARRLFQRELAASGPSHEVYFGLARAHLALGETTLARQALQQALEASGTPGEQARYSGKLAALRGATSAMP